MSRRGWKEETDSDRVREINRVLQKVGRRGKLVAHKIPFSTGDGKIIYSSLTLKHQFLTSQGFWLQPWSTSSRVTGPEEHME